MIDGIDYFPKRDKYKKGVDREWSDLKKIKTSQETKKDKARKTEKERPSKNDRNA